MGSEWRISTDKQLKSGNQLQLQTAVAVGLKKAGERTGIKMGARIRITSDAGQPFATLCPQFRNAAHSLFITLK